MRTDLRHGTKPSASCWFKLFNSLWKGRVKTWSSDIMSMQVPAFFAISHTVLFSEHEARVCVCWPDTQHVWTCQDSVYLSRVLTDALGCCWDTVTPRAKTEPRSARQEEVGRGPGFLPRSHVGPRTLSSIWLLPWDALKLNHQRREWHNTCHAGPAQLGCYLGDEGPPRKKGHYELSVNTKVIPAVES